MNQFTIGQIADKTGVSTHAIRMYENKGLLEPAQRAANGYRVYSTLTVKRLHFIKRAKIMGLSLQEISEILAIKKTAKQSCKQIRNKLSKKLVKIEGKIKELQYLRQLLNEFIYTCDDNVAYEDCPILDLLEQETNEEGILYEKNYQ